MSPSLEPQEREREKLGLGVGVYGGEQGGRPRPDVIAKELD